MLSPSKRLFPPSLSYTVRPNFSLAIICPPYCTVCCKLYSEEFLRRIAQETQKHSFIPTFSVLLLFITTFLIFPVKSHVLPPVFAMQSRTSKMDQDTAAAQ